MTPSRRSLRRALVALVALVIIAAGGMMALQRGRDAERQLASSLLQSAEDLSDAIDPGLVGRLSLDGSDAGTLAWERLTRLMEAYCALYPEQTALVAAIREGELRLGPVAPVPADSSTARAVDEQAFRAVLRSGRPLVFGPGEGTEATAIAMAPIRSADSGVVIGVVGLSLPRESWSARIAGAVWPLVAGALVLAALVLVSYGLIEWRSRQPQETRERWLHLETALIGAASLVVTALATLYVLGVERREREELFSALARTRVASVQSSLDATARSLSALSGFFRGSTYVSRAEFRLFVDSLPSSGLVAYQWVPVVNHGALNVFADLASREGYADYGLWELDAAGRVQPAGPRAEHYPILFIEPLLGNEGLLGYDLGSNPGQARALQQAASENLATALELDRTLLPASAGWDLLAIEPVSRPDAPAELSGGVALQGFVIGALQWDRLLGSLPTEGQLEPVDLDLLAPAASGDAQLRLLASTDRDAHADLDSDVLRYAVPSDSLKQAGIAVAFGEPVAILAHPSASFGALQPLRNWPAVALAGLSLGSLLTVVVGTSRQRETTLKRLVEERTASLADSEAHYRALFEEALNPILVAEADGRFIDANDAALAYLGRSREELLGKRLWDLAPRDTLRHATRTQTPFGLKRTLEVDVEVDQTVKTLLLSVIPVRVGSHVRLFAVGQDITERKRSERELERRLALERTVAACSSRFVGNVAYDAAVNESLAEIGTLLHAGRAYLFMVDEEGRTCSNTHEWCAPGLEPLRQQLQNVPLDGCTWWTDRLARGEVVVVPDVSTLDGSAPTLKEALQEHRIRSLVLLPFFVGNRLRGLLGLDNIEDAGAWQGEDISLLRTLGEILSNYHERVAAQEERLAMERQLLQSQKLESLGILAGGIGHDFNNLLAAILGNLELARLDLNSDSRARVSLEEAIAATMRAADLTRQMLAYSGKGHFVVTDIDLSALVEENGQILRSAIPRTATLELHLGRDLPYVRGDAGQLQQVVMNLLTNAAEALEGGPGTVTLTTGAGRLTARRLAGNRAQETLPPGEYVWLEVRDTGKGMDEATQARMFDPFFSTKEQGRGLGLGAVLGIIRGHKGGIWVQSSPGEGTLVRVAFPAVPRTGTAADSSGQRAATLERMTGGVLVVDDDDAVRRINSQLLKRMGLRTFVASDGEEAMRLYALHGDEIDCVLLDLTMPGMDGVATLEALRRQNPAVKAVLCTGYGEQVASEHFRNLGLAGFVQKPFQIAELRAVLESVLRSA